MTSPGRPSAGASQRGKSKHKQHLPIDLTQEVQKAVAAAGCDISNKLETLSSSVQAGLAENSAALRESTQMNKDAQEKNEQANADMKAMFMQLMAKLD